MSSAASHYDEGYFAWQKEVGEFAGWADLSKFQPHIGESDTVVDFGCGGGYLLRSLTAGEKIGVELNPTARQEATSQGTRVVASVDELPDGVADVLISNHALEHTERPLDELRALKPKVRSGGTVVFVVPCEGVSHRWKRDDINHHLYSWSPMSLANLFLQAGFDVQSSEPMKHKWTPVSNRMRQLGGRPLFDATSRIYGFLDRRVSQVKLVARA
jgi:SAM-dependent methyltransferase